MAGKYAWMKPQNFTQLAVRLALHRTITQLTIEMEDDHDDLVRVDKYYVTARNLRLVAADGLKEYWRSLCPGYEESVTAFMEGFDIKYAYLTVDIYVQVMDVH